MTGYYRYRVQLTNDGNRIFVEVLQPDGSVKNPSGPSRLSDIPEDITRLVERVDKGRANRTEMDELGEALFGALFSSEIAMDLRNLLAQVSREADDQTEASVAAGEAPPFLRLELDLDEVELPAVAALPWEFLRAPGTNERAGDNFATHPRLTLSRRRKNWDYAAPISRGRPLRIQLVVSAPDDLDPVAYEDVQSTLAELARSQPEFVAEPLPLVHQPTLERIDQILEEQQPDVLHFIGHGRLRRKGKGPFVGQLALVGAGDRAKWYDAPQIGDLFQTRKPPLVIFQACQSGAQPLSEALVGVASQLVLRNVPVVVAMQYPIDNHAATIFATEFYRRLAQFKPVDMAVQHARRRLKLRLSEQRDFAAPMLFMRVEDGRLFVPAEPAAEEQPGPEAAETAAEPVAPTFVFPQTYLADYAHPIAVACANFNMARSESDQFKALDGLLNNLVKYLTAIALSQYWQDRPDKNQLKRWLGSLSQARLMTSLTVLYEISEYYQPSAMFLSPLLFTPYHQSVAADSAMENAYRALRSASSGRRKAKAEDITPHTFLTLWLALRETRWERDPAGVQTKLRGQLLPALGPALNELLMVFQALLRFPLRYVERIDQAKAVWIYTMLELPGADQDSMVVDPFFEEENVQTPSYAERRLYLCAPNGQPQLNLHPFLIYFLNKIYFLEQAQDQTRVWYQHCASPERYQPPHFYSSIFLSASQSEEALEEVDDPVSQLEQASSTLQEEENKSRFDDMPLQVLLTYLSAEGREALEIALGEALRIGRFWLGVEFLLMGLSKQHGRVFPELLYELGLHPGDLRGFLRGIAGIVEREKERWREQDVKLLGAEALPRLRPADPAHLRQTLKDGGLPEPVLTPRLLAILRDAAKLAGGAQVGHTQLLETTLNHSRSLAVQLLFNIAAEAGWSPAKLKQRLDELAGLPPKARPGPDAAGRNIFGRHPDQTGRLVHGGSVLADFGRDLTVEAQAGRLSPAEGESARKAIAQIGRILLQREANNPILIGEPGVGKTAIVEGFAWRLAGQGREVVEKLAGRRVIELSINALTSGTKYRGDLEERLRQLLAEVKTASGQTIVFIDEIHAILGSGNSGAIADAIKPALDRGEFPTIGATTVAEYRQYIEKDAALARRFTPVWLEEPTVEEAVQIVTKVANVRLADHHSVTFDPEAIKTAVILTARYLHEERLPGKAIKILDQAASSLIVPGTLFGPGEDRAFGPGGEVTVEAVLEVIAERTNIPLEQLGKTDRERLLALEKQLKRRIIGQDEAVAQVVRVVKRAGAGLADPRRPQGVFLFAGPTGVGKTELALALTAALFDQEEAIFRLDMSEFMEKHQVARLTGAPPGYVGYEAEGQLTGHLRRQPYSVVLLDEIEKAHHDVQHLFLQLFDSGRLTDAQGRLADGRKAIFIMTTNLGAREALGLAGIVKSYQEKLLAAIHDHFSMEFINRIDRIVCFNPLDEAALLTIFDREFQPFQRQLEQEKQIVVRVADPVKQHIVAQAVEQKMGARSLRRLIEDQIIAPVIDKLLSGEYQPGTQVTIDESHGLDIQSPPASPAVAKFDLSGLGQLSQPAPLPGPKRPESPAAGLPQLDNVPDEDQATFDELYLALAQRLADQGIALEIDRLAKYFLCAPNAEDQKPRLGRSIAEAFDNLIEAPLTNQLLEDELKAGDWIKLDYSPDGPVIKNMGGDKS
jgi:ATP-dependent Clp protease ATP-binding subunit ClpC